MSDDGDDPGGVILQGPSDPDAQATVTDFIDYTEYLPSDIVRSLTLIRGLDESYLNAAASVHELTKTYGLLPNLPAGERPDPLALRKQISEQLERALNARESAYAESCRLYDVVDRHFDRLGSIKSKLLALASTLPAVNAEEASKDTKRTKGGRKIGETAPTPRLTLRVDGARQPGALEGPGDKTASQRGRQRGAAARTGHLASFNPDSPIASTEQSDEEVETDRVLPESSRGPEKEKPLLKIVQKKAAPGKNRKASQPAQGKRPGYIGRTPIELSTSNALAMLKPPPEDAKIGSEHLPWLRLSVWEMTTLRKRMKKNNIWQPSEVMVQRELSLRGRGWENYQRAKAEAEAAGTEFIDCDDIANNNPLAKGDGPVGPEESKPSNRGMKLNEAKKSKQMKRENAARGQAEQAALAAAEAEMAARRLGDIGSTFKSLFTSPAEQSRHASVPQQQQHHHGVSNDSFNANNVTSKDREKSKQAASKKRKLEETTAPEAGQAAASTSTSIKPAPKKLKLTKPTPNKAEETAAAEAAISTSKVSAAASRKASPATTSTDLRRSAAAPKAQPTPPPVSATRASSRPRSAASLDSAGRERLRKKSATPAVRAATPKQATTATSGRRNKRPAPGPVTAGQDGGAAVSVGHRKAKPSLKKKKDMSQRDLAKEGLRIDEDGVLEEIDPNEPRYCLCGDVSFGTMICCEDNDCDKEWFHLDCVGLSEVPSRTAKWYCPECRKKLGKDFPDGIVRSGNRR